MAAMVTPVVVPVVDSERPEAPSGQVGVSPERPPAAAEQPTITAEVLRRRWSEILGNVASDRAAAFLGQHAQVLDLRDDLLVLGFEPEMVDVGRRGNPQTITDAVYETVGLVVRLEVAANPTSVRDTASVPVVVPAEPSPAEPLPAEPSPAEEAPAAEPMTAEPSPAGPPPGGSSVDEPPLEEPLVEELSSDEPPVDEPPAGGSPSAAPSSAVPSSPVPSFPEPSSSVPSSPGTSISAPSPAAEPAFDEDAAWLAGESLSPTPPPAAAPPTSAPAPTERQKAFEAAGSAAEPAPEADSADDFDPFDDDGSAPSSQAGSLTGVAAALGILGGTVIEESGHQ